MDYRNKLETIYDIFSEIENYPVVINYKTSYGTFYVKMVKSHFGNDAFPKTSIQTYYRFTDTIGDNFTSNSDVNVVRGGIPNASESITFYIVEIQLKRTKSYTEINSILKIFANIRSMIHRTKSLMGIDLYQGTYNLNLKNSLSPYSVDPIDKWGKIHCVNWSGQEDNLKYDIVANSTILSICFVEK